MTLLDLDHWSCMEYYPAFIYDFLFFSRQILGFFLFFCLTMHGTKPAYINTIKVIKAGPGSKKETSSLLAMVDHDFFHKISTQNILRTLLKEIDQRIQGEMVELHTPTHHVLIY